MRKLFWATIAIFLATLAKPALAADAEDRLHLGLSSGFGIGLLTEDTTNSSSDGFSTISWMLHAGLRFTPAMQFRLSLGLDDYLNVTPTNNNSNTSFYDDGLFFTGDMDMLWLPLKGRLPVLDPYLLAGFGYPRLVHAGFGTDVSLGGIFAVFGEALYGTAFADHNGLARIGIKIKL